MKTSNYFKLLLFSLFTILQFSCTRPIKQEELNQLLAVHLQSGFDNDIVRVKFDGELVFDKKVTTINVLGFADGFSVDTHKGPHTLEIETKGKDALFAFDLKGELSIGISYIIDNRNITVVYSKEGFVYD